MLNTQCVLLLWWDSWVDHYSGIVLLVPILEVGICKEVFKMYFLKTYF